jgi:glutaredoxin 3
MLFAIYLIPSPSSAVKALSLAAVLYFGYTYIVKPIPINQQMSAKSLVESLIQANAVMVFSKSYCPYCNKAKALLSSLAAPFKAIELDQTEDGDAIQAYLAQKTGQRTVPSIFIGQEFVGSFIKRWVFI